MRRREYIVLFNYPTVYFYIECWQLVMPTPAMGTNYIHQGATDTATDHSHEGGVVGKKFSRETMAHLTTSAVDGDIGVDGQC
jgi:hypothetical protein